MLLSPWDVQPRSLTEAVYSAPAPARFGAELSAEGYYTDAAHSVIDPVKQKAYLDATSQARSEAEAIVKAADAFQATGSRAAAKFAINGLVNAAEDRFLAGEMRGNQAKYIRGWLVGAMAIAYLKVRPSKLASESDNRRIKGWLSRVAASEETFLGDAKNNHRYWGALQVSAIGIACDDRKLLDWGVASARLGLAQVQADGTLPLELARGAKALHYHFFAASPLVATAALLRPIGVDLTVENDRALARLVKMSLAAYGAPAELEKRLGIAQEIDKPDSLGWAIDYARKNGWTLPASLAQHPVKPYLYLGGMPIP